MSVGYKIIISQEAEAQLKRLDNSIAERIIEKIVDASKNPRHFFKRLVGREDYKLRIGEWRVIARILHKKRSIFIISIGHRKNIYK